jgi:hypothetical protein
MATWRGRLEVRDAREAVTLAISPAGVRVRPHAKTTHAVRGGDHVAQLLLGTDEPKEVAEAGKIGLAGDAGRLVEALFPAQHPMLQLADRF